MGVTEGPVLISLLPFFESMRVFEILKSSVCTLCLNSNNLQPTSPKQDENTTLTANIKYFGTMFLLIQRFMPFYEMKSEKENKGDNKIYQLRTEQEAYKYNFGPDISHVTPTKNIHSQSSNDNM